MRKHIRKRFRKRFRKIVLRTDWLRTYLDRTFISVFGNIGITMIEVFPKDVYGG